MEIALYVETIRSFRPDSINSLSTCTLWKLLFLSFNILDSRLPLVNATRSSVFIAEIYSAILNGIVNITINLRILMRK